MAATSRPAAGWPGRENRGASGRGTKKTKDRETPDQRVRNSCNVSIVGGTDLDKLLFGKQTSARMERRRSNVPQLQKASWENSRGDRGPGRDEFRA